MPSKRKQYDALVARRKKCRRCVGLSNPAFGRFCRFDSTEIGPWSRLHGDLDAQLMVFGQDWGDVDYYVRNRGLDDLNNPTSKNLERILQHIGMDVSLTAYSDQPRGLFLTNAILCLKTGGLQAKVHPTWIDNCRNVTTGTVNHAVSNLTSPDELVPRKLCRSRCWTTVTARSPLQRMRISFIRPDRSKTRETAHWVRSRRRT
jgi:DNA polymerase